MCPPRNPTSSAVHRDMKRIWGQMACPGGFWWPGSMSRTTPPPLQVAQVRASAAQALSEQKRRQEQALAQLRAEHAAELGGRARQMVHHQLLAILIASDPPTRPPAFPPRHRASWLGGCRGHARARRWGTDIAASVARRPCTPSGVGPLLRWLSCLQSPPDPPRLMKSLPLCVRAPLPPALAACVRGWLAGCTVRAGG
eukprot:COSAG01_NODE_1228_length_11129_cov_184.387851_10_plen_198_part_00